MKTITRSDLIREMQSDLDARVYRPVDEVYFCPSLGWLQEFAKGLPSRAPSFKSESFDCDNFAMRARVQADEAMLRSGKAGTGHTFGYCEVSMIPGMWLGGILAPQRGTHACNICRTDDDQWWFCEPQTGLLTRFADRPDRCVLAYLWV